MFISIPAQKCYYASVMKKKYEQKGSMWRKPKIRDRRHHDFDQRDSIVLRFICKL